MSQHRSLRGSSKITSKRNVLKRFERVNLLQKRGDWKEGDRGLGLKTTKPEAYTTRYTAEKDRQPLWGRRPFSFDFSSNGRRAANGQEDD